MTDNHATTADTATTAEPAAEPTEPTAEPAITPAALPAAAAAPAEATAPPAEPASPKSTAPAAESAPPESAPPAAEAAAAEAAHPEAPRPAAPRPPRRRLRAVLRWTAAVLVFAVAGGGSAYALTRAQRTDLPGLATPGDGRLAFPALTAVGQGRVNPGGHHLTDVRQLLLPAPEGAKPDPSFPGRDAYLSASAYGKLYGSAATTETNRLSENGCRRVAATAWTLPDGTRTQIYLLQFGSSGLASEYENEVITDATLADAPQSTVDGTVPGAADGVPPGTLINPYNEDDPSGPTHLRYAYIVSGDTVALVISAHKGSTAYVPFRQTVTLQAQLLG
ncbi:hypothetical protein [Streptomyces sp. ICBB 8177]|uniref:hypothetical protein n=1 Tax=Streptomyces sp. ICBB 8177 TaxID=563922 RepID=UPI000D677955|nr:hypothetical protein [Streptomyces sp. ICBB 8177]PWI45794.1 hypothetical protein CK485_01075 [Streptomyces sp. ICBB 8177]